jgi:hypothetical protein
LILVFSAFAVSCKKDDVASLEGKWNVSAITYREYFDYKLTYEDYQVLTGEWIEFRSDGRVERFDPGIGKRESEYTVTGNQVTFLGMTYQIIGLEEDTVILLDHHVHGAGEYHDTYLHLTR